MKVFISWSGDKSKAIATQIHDWLPTIIQSVKPYMSSENIDKGERWGIDISTQLQETNYGIICITRENMEAPWVLFESGALSKSIANSRVSPIIFGLQPSDLTKSPLLQFQLTQFNKTDMQKLVNSINLSSDDSEKINQEVLTRSFDRGWQELYDSISAVDVMSITKDSKSEPEIALNLSASIEEIISNTRAQIKMLNAIYQETLPKSMFENFLKEFVIKQKINTEIPISQNHPVWSELKTALKKSLNGTSTITNQIALHYTEEKTLEYTKDMQENLVNSMIYVDYIIKSLYGKNNNEEKDKNISWIRSKKQT